VSHCILKLHLSCVGNSTFWGWGTDIRADNLSTWHGKTLLGQVLQAVRRRLRGIDASSFKSRPVFPPSALEARIDTVSDSTLEVDPSIISSFPRRTNYGELIFLVWWILYFCLMHHTITASPSERHSCRIPRCPKWASAPSSAFLPLTMPRSRHGHKSAAALRRPRRFPASPPSTPVLLKFSSRAHGGSCRPPAPISRYLIEYRRRDHWEASGLWHFFGQKVWRTCPGSTEQPWSRSLHA